MANSDCHFSFPGTRVATEPGRAAPPEAVPGSGMPAPSKVALLGWAFINDSDDARNTPAEPFRDAALAAGAKVRVHDPWVDPVTSPDAPPGLSRDLEGVLAGADAVVVFAGHKEYRGLEPARVKGLCGCTWPVIVDGRNVVDPDAWIAAGFVYRGIGRGDKNRHVLRE